MLSKQDDFIGHQLPTTFDHVMSSDPAWMERLWYTGHPVPAGDFIFDIGLGWHPNRNVMDGFAGVAFDGRQVQFPRLEAPASQSPGDDDRSAGDRSARGPAASPAHAEA